MGKATNIKIPRVLLPTILGVSAYLIINKFFPEQVEELIKDDQLTQKDPLKDLRGGDIKVIRLLERIVKVIMTDRAVKIGILVLFTTAGYNAFHDEIEALLVNKVYQELCRQQKLKGKLKTICDIIRKYELESYSKSLQELLVSNLKNEDKLKMLKLKLECIFTTVQSSGKEHFLIMAMLSAICVNISGRSALALLSDALYILFKEGKIERAFYNQALVLVNDQQTSVWRKFMDRITRIRGGARVRNRFHNLFSKDALSLFLGIVVLFGLSLSAPIASQTATSLSQTQSQPETCHLFRQEHIQEDMKILLAEEEVVVVQDQGAKASTQTRKSKARRWNKKIHTLKDLSPLKEDSLSEELSDCTSVGNKVERITTLIKI